MSVASSIEPGARLSLAGHTVVVGEVRGRRPRSYARTHDVVICGVMDGEFPVEIKFRGIATEPDLEVQ